MRIKIIKIIVMIICISIVIQNIAYSYEKGAGILNNENAKLHKQRFKEAVEEYIIKNPPQIKEHYDSVYEYWLDMKKIQRSYKSFKIKYLTENYIDNEYFFYLKYPYAFSNKISSNLLYKPRFSPDNNMTGFIYEYWSDEENDGYPIRTNLYELTQYKTENEKIINREFDEFRTFFNWYEAAEKDYTPKFVGETKKHNNILCRVIDFYNNKTDEDIEICVSDKYGIAMYSKQKIYKYGNVINNGVLQKILTTSTMSIKKVETNNVNNYIFKLPGILFPSIQSFYNSPLTISKKKTEKFPADKPPAVKEYYDSVYEYYQDMKKVQQNYKSYTIIYKSNNMPSFFKKFYLEYPKAYLKEPSNAKTYSKLYDGNGVFTDFHFKEITDYKKEQEGQINHDKILREFKAYNYFFDWLSPYYAPKITNETEVYNGLPCRVIESYSNSGSRSSHDFKDKICVNDKYGIALYIMHFMREKDNPYSDYKYSGGDSIYQIEVK